jgi:hypothetical protein
MTRANRWGTRLPATLHVDVKFMFRSQQIDNKRIIGGGDGSRTIQGVDNT